jgi:transcriptional regulator with XRE-family HTH domain
MAKTKPIKAMVIVIDMITAAMTERGMLQEDLAGHLGVTPQRVSQILSGRYNVTVKTLARIAEALDKKLKIDLHD